MGFQIVTDSASDIPQETAAGWGVTVMPIHTRFGEEEYLDGVTLRPHEFFEKLAASDGLPRTSQVTPFEFREVFKRAVGAGDQVLCITMSGGVSGTWQSACAAAADFNEEKQQVVVIDSGQFCISLYVLVEYICRCRDQGLDLVTTVEKLRSEMGRVHVISVFSTLKYLKLGGRLSAAAALAGSLLSIKPVITITDGIVDVIARARGARRAAAMMMEFIEHVGGIDYDMPHCLGFTGESEKVLYDFVRSNVPGGMEAIRNLTVVPVGATVGTYAGPGAVALAFFHKKV